MAYGETLRREEGASLEGERDEIQFIDIRFGRDQLQHPRKEVEGKTFS